MRSWYVRCATVPLAMATRDSESPRAPRRRSPRRDGTRTTLRVPVDLAATTRRYAEELGTTPNDALIRLAERGAELVSGELEVARLAAERRAAVMGKRRPVNPDAVYPSAEEMDEAMRAVDEE